MAKFTFDENLLTIGDLEDFEDAIGLSLSEALQEKPLRDDEGNIVRHDCNEHECENDPCKDGGRPLKTIDLSAKVLKGLVWIASRQDNPDFTLEDARNVRVTELDIVRAGGDDDEPGSDPKDESA